MSHHIPLHRVPEAVPPDRALKVQGGLRATVLLSVGCSQYRVSRPAEQLLVTRWVLSLHQGLCLSDFEQTRSLPVRDYGIPPLVGGSFLFRRAGRFFDSHIQVSQSR
jgi:hypothetical protein